MPEPYPFQGHPQVHVPLKLFQQPSLDHLVVSAHLTKEILAYPNYEWHKSVIIVHNHIMCKVGWSTWLSTIVASATPEQQDQEKSEGLKLIIHPKLRSRTTTLKNVEKNASITFGISHYVSQVTRMTDFVLRSSMCQPIGIKMWSYFEIT